MFFPSYIDYSDEEKIVMHCLISHRTENDSLNYCKAQGFPMSKTKFSKLKNNLAKKSRLQAEYFASCSIIEKKMYQLEIFNAIIKELWNCYLEEKSEKGKEQILKIISKTEDTRNCEINKLIKN